MSNIDPTAEPAAKRARIASPLPTEAASIIIDTPVNSAHVPVYTANDEDPEEVRFTFEGETGLFGSLAGKIGRMPVTEPEVGITEFIEPSIAAISGIIKHRYVCSSFDRIRLLTQ